MEIQMSSLLGIGMVLIFVGMLFIFLGGFFTPSQLGKGKTQVHAAGGVFIGPFPIVGAFTDKRMFYILIAVALVFYVLWLFMVRRM